MLGVNRGVPNDLEQRSDSSKVYRRINCRFVKQGLLVEESTTSTLRLNDGGYPKREIAIENSLDPIDGVNFNSKIHAFFLRDSLRTFEFLESWFR